MANMEASTMVNWSCDRATETDNGQSTNCQHAKVSDLNCDLSTVCVKGKTLS